MKHNFEERRQRRIENAERLAAKNEAESNSAYKRASDIGSHIPFGQPILVGHHSERRHRADVKKIDNAMRKSVECSDKADYYANKAESIESNTAIFSDDPNALDKLNEKLEGLQRLQELMKATNKAIRVNKTDEKRIEALKELGFSDSRIVNLLTPERVHGIGFPSYSLTNNNANIRRLQQRIKHLENLAALETAEEKIGDIRIVSNVDANRVQIMFPSIPTEDTRKKLKSNGFRWSPSEKAWQRHLNSWAFRIAKDIVMEIVKEQTN
jgi:hypothetical protein